MTEAKPRRKMVLGRGLDALIPDFGKSERAGGDAYIDCALERIRPNRFQPRTRFSEKELNELAESIRTQGVLQPLLVRREGADFELVAGERRLRAARLAGLVQVPVVVREVSDAEMLEISIVENIQRENLNPMEEADAYQRLIDAFGLTQEEAARRVGRSRPTVANMLRLRQLPEPIKESIRAGELSMGHARALLGATNSARQLAAWKTVAQRHLSVRQTEALVRRLNQETPVPKPPTSGEAAHFTHLAEELSRHFGTKVDIQRRGRRGQVKIEFYSDEDLDRLLGLLHSS
jgi:ParB family transcriptional regulator, chromosome partitioning protein